MMADINLYKDSIIIGSGGAGLKIVNEVAKLNKTFVKEYNNNLKEGKEKINIEHATLVASDSEVEQAERLTKNMDHYLDLGFDGTGADPKVAIKHVSQKKEEIAKILENKKIVFHIIGLGGGTGVGTAMAIANMFKKKIHVFFSTTPDIRTEDLEVIENSLKAIKTFRKRNLGRLFFFDNRKNKDELSYSEFNKSIAKEINYIYKIPKIKMHITDIDTNDLISIMIPTGSERRGIITMKNFIFKDFTADISLTELFNRNKSASFDFGLEQIDRAGLFLEISKDQYLEDARKILGDLKREISNELQGAKITTAIYEGENDHSEVKLILSAPEVVDGFLEHKNKIKELQEYKKERLLSAKENAFDYNSTSVGYDLLDSSEEESNEFEDDLFSESEEKSLLDEMFPDQYEEEQEENDNDDLLNML